MPGTDGDTDLVRRDGGSVDPDLGAAVHGPTLQWQDDLNIDAHLVQGFALADLVFDLELYFHVFQQQLNRICFRYEVQADKLP